MNQDLFRDPANSSEILDSLKELKTLSDVIDKINETFPTWILGNLPKYSDDYSHLTRNWTIVCNKASTTPKDIIIVQYMIFDESHGIIRLFAEILTSFGFCVRRVHEIGKCSVCDNGIPTVELWKLMKSNNLVVPDEWKSHCRNCQV